MPDAPAPVYNTAGTKVAAWTIRLAYSDVHDIITLTCDRCEAEWAPSLHIELSVGPEDLQSALVHLEKFAAAANSVRLF